MATTTSVELNRQTGQYGPVTIKSTPDAPTLSTNPAPSPAKTSSMDSALQAMANSNPEAADKAMDALGYSNSPNKTTTSSINTVDPSVRDARGFLVDNPNYVRPKTASTAIGSTPAEPNTAAGRMSRLESIVSEVPEKPKTEAELVEERRKQAQAQIDAINKGFDNIIAGEREAGAVRDARTRAINLASGLGGSDFASANAEETSKKTRDIIAGKENERALAIASVFDKVDQRAREDAVTASAKYKADAETSLKSLKERQKSAKEDIATLGKQGMTIEKLKEKDPELLKALLEQSGYSELGLKAYLLENAPKAEKLGDAEANGKKFYFFKNADGTVRTETIEVPGLGETDKLVIAPDGTPIVYNDKGEVRIAEGFYEGQFAKPENPTSGDIQNADYQKGQKFVADNPDASPEELEQALRGNTKLSDSDINNLLKTKRQFLSKDYFKKLYKEEDLIKAAEDAGYYVKGSGFLGMGKSADTEAYLTSLEGTIELYRQAGYNDQQILKMMQDKKEE